MQSSARSAFVWLAAGISVLAACGERVSAPPKLPRIPWEYTIATELAAVSPDVSKLNGQRIEMIGFASPFTQTQDVKEFLFQPGPTMCVSAQHCGGLLVKLAPDVEAIQLEGSSENPMLVTGVLRLGRVSAGGDMFVTLFTLDGASWRALR